MIIYITTHNFRTTNTVYQFHGCFWHGCPKCKPENRDVTTKGKSLNQKLKHTRGISQYIRDLGYTLIKIWECEYRTFKKTNTVTNKYLYPTENLFRMTEKQILTAIIDEQIFGCVEVDISVPDNLKCYFQEMTPIFKHGVVKLQDIGQHMQDFLRKSNTVFKDRRYLIGSMFATKILIITPLLRWYIEHGIVVTKIYQLIEFSPVKCFETFANKVSDDRRAGDNNSNAQVIGDTSKLIGELI